MNELFTAIHTVQFRSRRFLHVFFFALFCRNILIRHLTALAHHLDLEGRLVLPVFRLSFGIKQGLDTQSGQLAKQGACLWRINARAATGRQYRPRQ